MKKPTVKEKYRHRTPTKLPTVYMIHIFNETNARMPRGAMSAIYTDLLKKTCSLNVIGIGNARAQKLNKTYRGKGEPANVLTFPPNDDGVAELYVNTAMAVKMAKKYHTSLKKQLLFLYIHGILHLLGYRHGAQMELLEDRYITMYT